MYEEAPDSEISLVDLFAVVVRRKAMIIAITLTAMVGVVVFAVVSLKLPPETSPLPNEYTPTALMLINNSSSPGGAMSSMLSASGLGGLAGLAGLSGARGATFSELGIFLLGTNTLLDTVVDTFDLIRRYGIDKSPRAALRAESRRALKKKLTGSYDEKSGVFSISFTDTDPVFAQGVVNFCVQYMDGRFNELALDKNAIEKENLELNIANAQREILELEWESRNLENSIASGGNLASRPAITTELGRLILEKEVQRQVLMQLTAQYELLKVSMSNETPVFQILEFAEIPDQKSGPSRGILCIIVTFAAAFFSVFLAFVLNAVTNIRQDPEAMAKLQRIKKEEAI